MVCEVRVEMKQSVGKLAPRELLIVQYVFAVVPFAALTSVPGSPLALGGAAWEPWATLGAPEWFVVALFIVLCMWFAAEYQVATVRKLGPAFTASLQPLRLISTVSVSWLWLAEPISGGFEWAGLLLVLGAISCYLSWDICIKKLVFGAATT